MLTAARFPFFSPIDEAGHFDYVRIVAEDHRLPVLGEDKIGYPVLGLGNGLDPDARPAPQVERPAGCRNESYQAFEPPALLPAGRAGADLTDDWSQRGQARAPGRASCSCSRPRRCCTGSRAGCVPRARLPIFSLA